MSRYIDADKLYIATMDTEFYDSADEDVVLELINQQPTADVQEVKHGKWIKIKNKFFSSSDGRGGNIVKCSVCGEPSACNFSTPYCSICGAKMDKESS